MNKNAPPTVCYKYCSGKLITINIMFLPIVLVTVYFASSSVSAAYGKPYYEVENVDQLFKEFVKEHKKVYNRREYAERLEIFKATLNDINERNDMFQDTVFAVNHFADLKPEELQQYRGFKVPNETISELEIPAAWESAPDSYDWRQHNAVTHVKDQMQCGSCFIFSAVGEIEGQYARKHQQLVALSEQQALDCLNVGTCGGGWMSNVMQELFQDKLKLGKEEEYPYVGYKDQCKTIQGIAQSLGGKRFKMMDEESLKELVYSHGPVSIAIIITILKVYIFKELYLAISASDFNSYQGGILEPNSCMNQDVDHAVLIVGYGEESGKKYWIIKNSWATTWGESGYVRLLRGVNACGIGSELATSTVQ